MRGALTLLPLFVQFQSTLQVNPIVVRGNLLYDSVTKQRFYIKGVTYDPRPHAYEGDSECPRGDAEDLPKSEDVLADGFCCNSYVDWRQDLQEMVAMNINVIRLYSVNPFDTHSSFMEEVERLGLYVIVPLTGMNWGFFDAGLSSPGCYGDEIEGYGNVGSNLLLFAKKVVSEFSQYRSTLLYTVGNEIVLWGNEQFPRNTGYSCMPCLKAFIRDVHRFQTSCLETMRRVPLMYAAQDRGRPARGILADYLTCQHTNEDDQVDVFGINTYSWCTDDFADFHSTGYFTLNEDFQHYSKPVILSEFGCTGGTFTNMCPYQEGGRTFSQVKYMMGDEMQETLSGGLAYEFSMQTMDFGLVMGRGFTKPNELRWTAAAYHLKDAYATSPSALLENHQGDWTDADRCTWVPPQKLLHTESICPNNEVVDALWNLTAQASSSETHSRRNNWYDSLPPAPPEYEIVDCPAHSLTPDEIKENVCALYPTPSPSIVPSPVPSRSYDPTPLPSSSPTKAPSRAPTVHPTHVPTPEPSESFTPTRGDTLPPSVPVSLLPSPAPSLGRAGAPASSGPRADSASSGMNFAALAIYAIGGGALLIFGYYVFSSFFSSEKNGFHTGTKNEESAFERNASTFEVHNPVHGGAQEGPSAGQGSPSQSEPTSQDPKLV